MALNKQMAGIYVVEDAGGSVYPSEAPAGIGLDPVRGIKCEVLLIVA